MGQYQKQDCLTLLQAKAKALAEEGICRFPKRSDFSEEEVVAIKAFLGPWPRALEAAGVKPPRDDDRAQRNKEKRIRTKRAKIAALKQIEKAQKENKGK